MRITVLLGLALLQSAAVAAQSTRIYPAPSAGLLRGDDSPRAVLGLSTSGSTSARDTLGLLVSSVAANGPADRAGIQEGDRIASINGVNLRMSPDDAGDFETSNAMTRRLTRELSRVRPGDDVDLRVYSGGRTRNVRVKTGDSDSVYARRRVTRNEMDERPTLGLRIASTGSKRDTLGVLVLGVDDSGPAARAGIEEGNRIAAIDEVDLRVGHDDAGDDFLATSKVRRLQREVARLRPGDNVDLRVYSNGDYRTVRLRVARSADLPRKRNAFIITGDGMGMGFGPDAFNFNVDGALIGEQVRTAIERAMEASGKALEGVGRGLGRARTRSWDDDDDDVRARRVAPPRPIEPMEPIHIEPLEPSRMRRVAPSRVPFTSVLLDDSSVSAPMVSSTIMARGALRRSNGREGSSAALDINGLRVVAVGSELAAYLGKGSDRGLLVLDVPEWARGTLRGGDVILSVDDAPVRGGDGGYDIALPRFREAQLDILRDGVHHSVTLPARR